jgi:hypothetical protein
MRADSLGYDLNGNNGHYSGGLLMSEMIAHTTMKAQNPLLNRLEPNQAVIH